jgi:hypothetical protein
MLRIVQMSLAFVILASSLSWTGAAQARNFAPRNYTPAYGNPYWYVSPSSYANPYWYGYAYGPYAYSNSPYAVSSGAGPAGNTPLPFGFGGYSFGASGFALGASDYQFGN